MAFRSDSHDDLTKFGNRLWALMTQKSYDSAKKLATALYNDGLITVNQKQETVLESTEEELRKNAIGSIERRIDEHINSSSTDKVKGRYIVAYCKHFGCSADYLFGLTPIMSDDPEIRRICELTGLKESTILKLKNSVEKSEFYILEHDFWCTILESDLFSSLPSDYYSAYREFDQLARCRISTEAIDAALEKEDPSSIPYNLISAKRKSYQLACSDHHSAFYGLLYKISQNLTSMLESNIVSQTFDRLKEDKTEERIFKKYKKQLQAAKRAEKEVHDEDFEFNVHPFITEKE